ncbi:uncharacterized protein TNCV_3603571 [Trichonephila clavipes]|nr:uncharacterized protein TNCV_3603571 [Trichonephila clavipes]
MGAAIPNVLQPGAFVWFEKIQWPLVKLLPVPGWRPMKQLAVRVHFIRYGGLLNNWSVEGVLSLVFVQMTSLGFTGTNTFSQHNQSGLIDELLAYLTTQLHQANDSPPLQLRQLLILSSKTV